VIARHSIESDKLPVAAENGFASEQAEFDGATEEGKPSRKRDWL
jgi:hypothetical protein